MRESRIICPDGHPYAIDKLEHALIDAAGGFTRTVGNGAWKNDAGDIITESVVIYDVAGIKDDTLWQIARSLAADADQDCVYIRRPFGEARLVPRPMPNVPDAYRP